MLKACFSRITGPPLKSVSLLSGLTCRRATSHAPNNMKPPNVAVCFPDQCPQDLASVMQDRLVSLLSANCYTTHALTCSQLKTLPLRGNISVLVAVSPWPQKLTKILTWARESEEPLHVLLCGWPGSDPHADGSCCKVTRTTAATLDRSPGHLVLQLVGTALGNDGSCDAILFSEPEKHVLASESWHGLSHVITSSLDLSFVSDHQDAVLRYLLRRLGLRAEDRPHYNTPSVQPEPLFLFCFSKGTQSVKRLLLYTGQLFIPGAFRFLFVSGDNTIIPEDGELKVLVDCDKGGGIHFDAAAYQQHLNTLSLGQIMMYSNIVTSTQDILNSLANYASSSGFSHGLTVIAGQQSRGKGRSGNTWLSPEGGMNCSVLLSIDLASRLGSHCSIVQQVTALAVVKAINSFQGFEKFEAKIKWPNDIYYKDKIKLGGIMATSICTGSKVHITLGIGVNVSNSLPTSCINDIVKDDDPMSSPHCTRLRVEELIAAVLTQLEQLLISIESCPAGLDWMKQQFLTHWLHSGAVVRIHDEEKPVTIQGIDDYGFLLVSREDGTILTLQPDGNSLDLMRNLIIIKNSV